MKALSIGSFDSFWKLALVAGGIAAWSLPVWNLVINPYQIFKPSLSIGERFSSSTTNERFLKVEYLLKSAKQPIPNSSNAIIDQINNATISKESTKELKSVYLDSFIVGSSIMGLIDPTLLNQKLTGHFYNLAFLAAKPDEILATLRGLKHEGVPIKTVIYGIEPIAFTDTKSYGPAYQMHSVATEKSRNRIFFDYLFASSLSDGFSRLVTTFSGSPSVKYDIEGSGRYYLQRYDNEIKEDQDAFMRKQFPSNTKHINAPPWIDSRFDDFKKLAEWLKAEKVDTKFYLNPLHPHIVEAYGKERLTEFKNRIGNLTGIESFVDCSNILIDGVGDVNQRFYDYKHFRPSESATVLNCAIKRTHVILRKHK